MSIPQAPRRRASSASVGDAMSCSSSSSSSSISPSFFSLLPSSASNAKSTFVFFYPSSSSKRFSGIRASRSAYLSSLSSHKRIKEQLNLDAFPVKDARQGCQHVRLPTQCFCQDHPSSVIDKSSYPQNADLPRYYSKKEKKPFPIPILELRRAARERQKKARGKPRRPMPPPKNGMLVRSLIPVAYEVMNARILLINNLKRLMKVVPVQACKYCNEIHVGQTGHPFKSCRGLHADKRRGLHEWTNATVEDVFLPVEAYHLFDRLGKRIPHGERFSIPRVPAVVELCVQAGVDLPDLPTKRRRKPVIRIRKNEIIDANEDDLPDPKPDKFKKPILDEIPDSDAFPPSSAEETASLAEETLEAWETLRQGAGRLMRKYAVRVCGYCPEVHVGSSGHKAQNCGAFKHQQRNGQHGWQAAVIDDLIPPRFVWHVPETGSELQRELRNFYGQAPAVVELCIQGGARVPEQYKPTMRLDVGIPTNLREAEMVV